VIHVVTKESRQLGLPRTSCCFTVSTQNSMQCFLPEYIRFAAQRLVAVHMILGSVVVKYEMFTDSKRI
jgi:hypothetical protein